MKKMIKLGSIAAVALVLTQTLQAIPINGNITFSGSVVLNTGTAATATAVTAWISPIVNSDSGTFAAPSPFAIANGTPVVFNPATWNFSTVVGLNPFWSVGGFTFQLLSSYVLAQGGTPGLNAFVVVDGTGIISGNGYTPTVLSWSFTTADPNDGRTPPSWSFQASSNSIPDGGATVMLLGIALSGLGLLKKKLTA